MQKSWIYLFLFGLSALGMGREPKIPVGVTFQSTTPAKMDLCEYQPLRIVTVGGSFFGSAKEISLADFIAMTDDQITTRMQRFFDLPRDFSQADAFVIDIEHAEHPASWWYVLKQNRTTFNDLINAYKRRIHIWKRELALRYPGENKLLGMYGITAGRNNERERLNAYLEAGRMGFYDELDFIGPSVYANFGAGDIKGCPSHIDADPKLNVIGHGPQKKWKAGVIRYVRKEMQVAQSIRNSLGLPLPVYVYFSDMVYSPYSCDNRKPAPTKVLRLMYKVARKMLTKRDAILYWFGASSAKEYEANYEYYLDFLVRTVPEFKHCGK